jgi:hypothetical protein
MEGSPVTKRIREASLESVPSDIDPMDAAVLGAAPDEPSTLQSAIYLLLTIVAEANGMLNPKYRDITAAKALLEEHPDLVLQLQAAWKAKTFKEIRALGA